MQLSVWWPRFPIMVGGVMRQSFSVGRDGCRTISYADGVATAVVDVTGVDGPEAVEVVMSAAGSGIKAAQTQKGRR